jgi:polynucleotide 5'-hydroxyl-kinase GRC3/NOL9
VEGVLNPNLEGKKVIICVGGVDSGKTSWVRSIVDECRRRSRPVIHIDLDMGQSTIGPPATIGLRGPSGREYLSFVGNTSPVGVTGAIRSGLSAFRRIIDSSPEATAIADTPGLPSGWFGWFLTRMTITHLRADCAVILDRSGECAGIVDGIKKLGTEYIVLTPRQEATRKTPAQRARYRQLLFRKYFRNAHRIVVHTQEHEVADMDGSHETGTLVGLLDGAGFLVRLAVFENRRNHDIVVLAPPCDLRKVAAIKFGRYVLRR